MSKQGIVQTNKEPEYLTEDLSRKYGITVRVEKITPDIARKYLMRRKSNQRKISASALNKYMSDLKAGQWELNGEALVFNKAGELLNGNHRLTAVIKSQVSLLTLVVYGIDESVSIFDVPKKRSPKDTLQMNDIDLAPVALTAAKNICGMFEPVGTGYVNEYARSHQRDLRIAYTTCCTGANGKYSQKACCVLAAYLMLRTETAQTYQLESFFDIYNSKQAPEGLTEGDPSPAIAARNTIDNMSATVTRRSRTQLEVIVRAIEDFLARRKKTGEYTLDNDMHWESYAKKVRKEDGLINDED